MNKEALKTWERMKKGIPVNGDCINCQNAVFENQIWQRGKCNSLEFCASIAPSGGSQWIWNGKYE